VGTGQFPLRLHYGRSPHAYVNQRLQIRLEHLMMCGMPLEACWAVNERWNHKFSYKVASCWLFLMSRFWKFYITRCSMVGETAATSSLMFCFKSIVVPGFFCTPCSWDILRGRSIATRDTRSDEYWSANGISSESRQNRFFWKSSPQQKPDALQTSAPWQLKCFESR